eukprot:1146539-Pelagomonas_calceolata.AAC.3
MAVCKQILHQCAVSSVHACRQQTHMAHVSIRCKAMRHKKQADENAHARADNWEGRVDEGLKYHPPFKAFLHPSLEGYCGCQSLFTRRGIAGVCMTGGLAALLERKHHEGEQQTNRSHAIFRHGVVAHGRA